MITPLKGLFNIILKSPFLSQLRVPTGMRQTSWLFTKRSEFAPGIMHRGQIHSVARVGDLNPGLPYSNPQL